MQTFSCTGPRAGPTICSTRSTTPGRRGGPAWWTGVVDRRGGPAWWTGVVDRKTLQELPNDSRTGQPSDRVVIVVLFDPGRALPFRGQFTV